MFRGVIIVKKKVVKHQDLILFISPVHMFCKECQVNTCKALSQIHLSKVRKKEKKGEKEIVLMQNCFENLVRLHVQIQLI